MPPSVSHQDRALILRRHPYSESSLIVHAISREHGKVHLVARGAYRPRSRFYCLLDLFHELHLEWSGSPERELKTLRNGSLLTRRRGITEDLAQYRAALSLLELTELGSRPGAAEPELYDELSYSLDRLSAGSSPPDFERISFELAFLQRHGLAPALFGCATCGGPARTSGGSPPRAWFSAGAGGRLCGGCADEARKSGRRVGTLPLDVLVTADKISRYRAGGDPPPRVAPPLLVRVRDFVERFLDYHLETRPRSHRKFLATPNRNSPDRTLPPDS
jgi:DNA repair protein RecO (recombination protein O)